LGQNPFPFPRGIRKTIQDSIIATQPSHNVKPKDNFDLQRNPVGVKSREGICVLFLTTSLAKMEVFSVNVGKNLGLLAISLPHLPVYKMGIE